MAEPLPLTLRVYRLLASMAPLLVNLMLDRRLKRGKEVAERLPERRGVTAVARPAGPLVWLHVASVGEMLSMLPLIERILSRGIAVLLTSWTVTAAELAGRRLPAGVIHQFIPVDVPQFVARFLDHWRPSLALFAESDLWPNLIVAASDRNIPLILVNGRVSQRSFLRWKLLPRTIAALLGRFDLCLAQSAEDAARYAALGAPRHLTTGNLKLDVPAPPADATSLRQLQAAVAGRPVIAAASTHPGEETEMAHVHRKLRYAFSDLLTILVPRHPERGASVAGIAQSLGLSVAQRSLGELPSRETEIYVADTLGELGLIYRIAPIVFIGGSLIEHGGQNPIEAAKLGAAIVHGPYVWNFAEIYSALDAAGGAEMVPDTGKLTMRIGMWLKNADTREQVARAGLRTVDTLAGALERTVTALDPYLMQLSLEPRGGPTGRADNA